MTSTARTRWILAGGGALAIAVIALLLLHRKPPQARPPPSVPVAVAQAKAEDFPVVLTALGAAQAWKSDMIFAQVSGILIRVDFKEGSYIRAGQVLAEVDPSTYRAALTQAEGQLHRDQALLAEARIDLARYQALLKEDSISRQQAEDQAQVVKQDEGTVLLDQGSVENARVNLGRCRIVSPISGRAGVRLVDPGNLVSASGSVSSLPATAAATSNAPAGGASAGAGGPAGSAGSGIVMINQIQPIAVTFTVPQGEFQRLFELSDHLARPLKVQAYSQETGALIDTGDLSIVDNRVNPATGTVELKASFPNAAQKLWPGQFVNVQLTLQTLKAATVIPSAAVNRGPKGQFVFVVGPNNRAVMRPVQVGGSEGDLSMVASGVRPGERVVIDGQMTLKNGSRVRIAQRQPVGQTVAASP